MAKRFARSTGMSTSDSGGTATIYQGNIPSNRFDQDFAARTGA